MTTTEMRRMNESGWRRRVKGLAGRLGVQRTEDLYRWFAMSAYRKKARTEGEYRRWLEEESPRWVAGHWAYTESAGFASVHLTSQLYEIAQTLRSRLGAVGDARVLDAGASDGFFLTEVGARRGVGVNIIEACGRQVRAHGFQGTIADIESLPFPDKTFDYVICCETLEHVPNPIRTLNELARVCRTRLFITVPWLARTRINRRGDDWPESEHHIFEFNEADFSRVLSHANVRVTYRAFVHVFPEPRNPLLQWWFATLMYPSYFPRLQYVELEPVAARAIRIAPPE